MTPRVRRVLIWSGLFVLAFAGGSMLGGFTVSGLAGDKAVPGLTDASNFWEAQDRARATQGPPPKKPVDHFVAGYPESHDCENCDASVARDKQTADYIASQYGPPLGDGRGGGGVHQASPPVPPPPPAPPAAPTP